jgi:hypothetical protein
LARLRKLDSVEALQSAVASLVLTPLRVTANRRAITALKRAAVEAGMVLCGEIHGVADNPAIAYSLMGELDLHALALEWPPNLMPVVEAFLASGRLDPDAVLDAPRRSRSRGRCAAGGGCCTGSGTSTGPLARWSAWAGGCTGFPMTAQPPQPAAVRTVLPG